YTLGMLGFACGGVVLGRLSDRFGIMAPLVCGVVALSLGYLGAGAAPNLMLFTLAHALIGFGASASFGPLIAETSQWFVRRRGMAVAIASCGNSLAGTVGPPVVQHFIASSGWRITHVGIAIFCALAMPPLMLTFRRRLPRAAATSADLFVGRTGLSMSPNALQ